MTKTDRLDLRTLPVINVDEELPDVGKTYIMQLTVEGTLYEFAGELLAEGSSQSDQHRDHPMVFDPDTGGNVPAKYAPKGVKCSACRWLEVELYRKYPDEGKFDDMRERIYVVVTRGPSAAPGERDYEKITFTESPYEVVEVLTVRKTRGTQSTFLPPQHARALAQAAAHDEGIKDAYIRTVA